MQNYDEGRALPVAVWNVSLAFEIARIRPEVTESRKPAD
jgi:hypothetical protein